MSDNLTDRLLALESAAAVASERLTMQADATRVLRDSVEHELSDLNGMVITVLDRLDGIERAIRPLRAGANSPIAVSDEELKEMTREREEWKSKANSADEALTAKLRDDGLLCDGIESLRKERNAWRRRATFAENRLTSLDALNAPATHAEMEQAKADEEKEWMDAAMGPLKDDAATASPVPNALPPCPLCGRPAVNDGNYTAWCSDEYCVMSKGWKKETWIRFPRRAAILAEVRAAFLPPGYEYYQGDQVTNDLLVALEAKK